MTDAMLKRLRTLAEVRSFSYPGRGGANTLNALVRLGYARKTYFPSGVYSVATWQITDAGRTELAKHD